MYRMVIFAFFFPVDFSVLLSSSSPQTDHINKTEMQRGQDLGPQLNGHQYPFSGIREFVVGTGKKER